MILSALFPRGIVAPALAWVDIRSLVIQHRAPAAVFLSQRELRDGSLGESRVPEEPPKILASFVCGQQSWHVSRHSFTRRRCCPFQQATLRARSQRRKHDQMDSQPVFAWVADPLGSCRGLCDGLWSCRPDLLPGVWLSRRLLRLSRTLRVALCTR